MANIEITPQSSSIPTLTTREFKATVTDSSGKTISAATVTWTSSNQSVATISSSGLATGVSPGDATITAAIGSVISNPAPLTVTSSPITSITIAPTSASIEVSATRQYTATDGSGNAISGTSATWMSSNEGVATISSSGIATGVSPGATTITVSAGGVTSDGASLTVVGGGGGGNRYSTNFPLTENPISEGGNWINGYDVGLDWANIKMTPGFAFGTQTGFDNYNDSIAILTGTWGQNQTAQATIVINGSGEPQEIELRLNNSISPNRITGYEFTYDTSGTISIARYDGPIGLVIILTLQAGLPGGKLVTGDVLKATRVGDVLTAYRNGQQVAQVQDATYLNGSPGIGFFLRAPSVTNTNFGVSSFQATD